MTTEPPNISDEDPDYEDIADQAEQFNQQISKIKEWANAERILLQHKAEVAQDEDNPDADPREIAQAAQTVKRLFERIEYGDSKRV